MKLYIARTSPYARKVAALVHEKGAEARTRVAILTVDPWADPADLHAAAPSGKVPALVTADGWCLGESWAIAEYLDAVLPGRRLLPAEGPARWRALRLSALAHGLMDAAFSAVIEGRRPAGEQSPGWVARQKAAIARSLPVLEAAVPDLCAGGVDLGALSVACALDYLDFRHADIQWRQDCTLLSGWFAEIIGIASMEATNPR